MKVQEVILRAASGQVSWWQAAEILGSAGRFYFWRLSRDLHCVDVCVANAEPGEVKPIIEERLNTYIEPQPL